MPIPSTDEGRINLKSQLFDPSKTDIMTKINETLEALKIQNFATLSQHEIIAP